MLVRENYQKNIHWTYDEAAEYAGLSASRIKHLAGEVLGGRRRWKDGLKVGPYKVDAQSFMAFCRTGEAQGPPA